MHEKPMTGIGGENGAKKKQKKTHSLICSMEPLSPTQSLHVGMFFSVDITVQFEIKMMPMAK